MGGDRVPRRVADDEGLLLVGVEAFQRRFEDVRVRLAALGIVGAGLGVDQIVDARKLLVRLQLFAFRRGSEGDAHLAADQFLEQLACLRKSADALQVPALVEIGSVLLDGLASPRQIVL